MCWVFFFCFFLTLLSRCQTKSVSSLTSLASFISHHLFVYRFQPFKFNNRGDECECGGAVEWGFFLNILIGNMANGGFYIQHEMRSSLTLYFFFLFLLFPTSFFAQNHKTSDKWKIEANRQIGLSKWGWLDITHNISANDAHERKSSVLRRNIAWHACEFGE